MKRIQTLLSGIIICFVISGISQYLASFMPQIGAALFAIFIGMLLGNTVLNRENLQPGVKFSEKRLLEYSICLMGLTLSLTDIVKIQLSGVVFVLIQISLTILFALWLGKKLGFKRKFTLLMAAGNAVCGSSAIGTVAPIIGSDKKDKGISIATVNITGTVLMIVLPLVVNVLYHKEALVSGALIGGVLQSVGQVIASAKLVSIEVVEFATIFKIIRIISLVIVCLVFARLNPNDNEAILQTEKGTRKKVKAGIPWFITVFFIFCLLNSGHLFPQIVSVGAKVLSNQLEVAALAGIGMGVKFLDVRKEGMKSLGYGFLIGSFQVISAGLLIRLLL